MINIQGVRRTNRNKNRLLNYKEYYDNDFNVFATKVSLPQKRKKSLLQKYVSEHNHKLN